MSSQKQVKVTLPSGFKADNVRVENGLLTYDLVEDKFQPKDGDFVCFLDGDGNRMPFIFKESIDDMIHFYMRLNAYGMLILENSYWDCDLDGYATEEEKQQLLDEMSKHGYSWDAENREVLKKLWRAKEGGEYWYILESNYAIYRIELFNECDDILYNSGNYFRTKEEAKEFIPKVKELFNKRRKL